MITMPCASFETITGNTKLKCGLCQHLLCVHASFWSLKLFNLCFVFGHAWGILNFPSVMRWLSVSNHFIINKSTAVRFQVYLASASPPVRYPNVYGVDMPTRHEFVAYNKTEEEICAELGADGLLYQSVEDLISAANELNPDIKEFDTSCFTGVLPPLNIFLVTDSTGLCCV